MDGVSIGAISWVAPDAVIALASIGVRFTIAKLYRGILETPG